ncbi:MAG: uroporphyrinogen-III C-methyltransferase [Candidatus Krumholzibacteriia bacterium]
MTNPDAAAGAAAPPGVRPGTVYLVGAGPGDPGLLTMRGNEVLARCDAVVYDRLAAWVLPPDLSVRVQLHYVGKRADHHALPQERINELLVDLARRGLSVCRLKGGDPFVFGRGGEEAEVLRREGIPFEVVPGVTAGIAAAAYAGIPVTHRGESVRVCLVTAHEDPTKPSSQVDWSCFGKEAGCTVAAYMPVGNLERIAQRMIAGGADPDLLAAVIERGTLPSQRTVVAPLHQVAEAARTAGVKPPALFLVGPTVGLHAKLAWYKERIHVGKRVIVTRPADQSRRLIRALQDLGVEALVCPAISTEPADPDELRRVAHLLPEYDWVFFTSENGVRYFFTMLTALDLDIRALGRVKVATVGHGTAERLREYHLHADFYPTAFRAEILLQEFLNSHDVKGLRILRVRGERARPELEDGLRAAGAEVDTLLAYHIRPTCIRADVADTITVEGADAVTFTSGSSVEGFETILPDHSLHERVPAVCIGPVTAAVAERVGWRRVITASVSTVPGLIEAVTATLGGSGNAER